MEIVLMAVFDFSLKVFYENSELLMKMQNNIFIKYMSMQTFLHYSIKENLFRLVYINACNFETDLKTLNT